MFVTNWNSTTKIQKISEITNFFRHYFLSRTEVRYYTDLGYEVEIFTGDEGLKAYEPTVEIPRRRRK